MCGGALMDRPCMVLQRVCCCASDPNERLSAPSIYFFCVFVCQKLSPSFRSLRAGSQVFALLMLFLCVILHTKSSGKSPVIAMHLSLWYVVLVCHQYDVCENYVGSVYVGGYGGLSKEDSVSSVNCVQSAFL